MLIGCITGPDFETVKRQIEQGHRLCDALEIRYDLIDDDIAPLIKEISLPIFDCSTISTYHNFDETPKDLESILNGMPKGKIYKICTMARSTIDALRMLNFVSEHENVAGMCMGPFGQITRILAPIVGNPLTFAALGREAAPSQMQASELVETYHFHDLSPKTKIYGLIGQPVSQSPSHKTHNSYFYKNQIDAVYVKMQLNESELSEFFDLARRLDIQGLSVTMPYKEKLFDFIDTLEPDAEKIGAVNTLMLGDNMRGANTDGIGALDAIESIINVSGKDLVIIGDGGSSKAIQFEARKRGSQVKVCSRRCGNLHKIPTYDILINTTPLHDPIDRSKLLAGKVVMDINFDRQNSQFMMKAGSLGCRLVYGETMFEKQAEGQFSKWGQRPSS